MTDTPLPSTPDEIKAWVAGLDKADLSALAGQLLGGGLAGRLGALDLGFQRNAPIEVPPPPSEPVALTLTIELHGSKPRIWRRLRLPGDLTLDQVHLMFQAAMGWTDSHLHRFWPGANDRRQPYFITEFDEDEGDDGTREDEVRLDQALRTKGDRLTYEYDFGDGWEHRVTLESSEPLTDDNREPLCLKGAKACPPEDVGGLWGHHQLAEWLRAGAPEDAVPDPFDDAAHAHGWLPESYDPDHFDPAEATAAMQQWASGTHLPWHSLPEPLVDVIMGVRGPAWSTITQWLDLLTDREPVTLTDEEVEAIIRPIQVLLAAVGDGVKLTAAGYLPPTMVQQIADDTGVSDWWIGKANREDQTYPVAILRESAQDLGLLRKRTGMLLPTSRAKGAMGDARRLLGAVLERLPIGKRFEAEAGWLFLLAAAAGADGPHLDHQLAELLTDKGWRTQDGRPVADSEASRGSSATRSLLEDISRDLDQPPELVQKAARAALFGLRQT